MSDKDSPFEKEVKKCVCEKIGVPADGTFNIDLEKFPEITRDCIYNVTLKNQKTKERPKIDFFDLCFKGALTSTKTKMKEKRIDQMRSVANEFAEEIYLAEERVKELNKRYAEYINSVKAEFDELWEELHPSKRK